MDDLSTTNFFSATINNNFNSWASFSTITGTIDGPHDVLYLAWNMGGGGEVLRGIDNVNFQVQVPEPNTMLLLGFGLFGLAAVGRKKFFKK